VISIKYLRSLLFVFSLIPIVACAQPKLAEPRLAPVPTAELTEEQVMMMGVDPEKPDLRVNMNLFKTMVLHPELLKTWSVFAERLASLASMTNYDRELVIMRLAVLTNGTYEWAQHYDNALKSGLTEEQIAAVKIGSSAPIWNDWERTLLTTAEQLRADAFITDEVYAALLKKYTVQEIMDILALTAHYYLTAMMTNTIVIQLDPHHVQHLK